MITMEELRSQYMDVLGQSEEWTMCSRNGKTTIINTYSFEEFMPYYISRENKRTQIDSYYNRQQYILPNTPKLIILPHKDPAIPKTLLLVQHGQYDFEKLVAFHRQNQTQLQFVQQILHTACMLSKKYGFFYITPNMVRASKGPSLLLWFSDLQINNEPALRCPSQDQMVMNILQLMVCNFLTIRQLQILIEIQQQRTFNRILRQIQKLIKVSFKEDKKSKGDSLNLHTKRGNIRGKNTYQNRNLPRNGHLNFPSSQFTQQKQYYSVHGSFPITSRDEKSVQTSKLNKKNQNSSINVIGRKKKNYSFKTDGQGIKPHPYSQTNFKPLSIHKHSNKIQKDTSLQSFSSSIGQQFHNKKLLSNFTSKNDGAKVYTSEKNKSENIEKKNFSKFKEWNQRIQTQKFLQMHQKNKKDSSFKEKRRCTMENAYKKNSCWNNLRLTGNFPRTPPNGELYDNKHNFVKTQGNFEYPKWTKIERTTQSKYKNTQIEQEEQVMTFRVQDGEKTQREEQFNHKVIEKHQFNYNQAKVRDSGKSISTAAHHFSVSSSDRRKIQDCSSSMGSKGGPTDDKFKETAQALRAGINGKGLQYFCRDKENGKLDMKVSKIIEQYNQQMYGSSPSRQYNSTGGKNPIDASMLSRVSQIDRDVSMLFRSGAVDRTFIEGSNVFAGMEKQLNRIWFE